MTERRSRLLDSRVAESRALEMESFETPAEYGQLYVNPDIIPPDIVVGWFPRVLYNKPEWENIKDKIRDKNCPWVPCPPEMFPSLVGGDTSKYFDEAPSRFIERSGNILMMCSKEVWRKKESRYNEETRAVMQQANVASAYLSDHPNMPFTTQEDYTSYGEAIIPVNNQRNMRQPNNFI